MRGAPQRGSARAMVRTSSAISESTGGRPVRPRRDFQFPERAKALPVPANHGLRLNDMERFAPPYPPLREPHPEDAVEETDPRSLGAAAEQGELLSQRQVLKNEVGAGLQRSAHCQQSEDEGPCYAGSLDRRTTSSVATDILANDKILEGSYLLPTVGAGAEGRAALLEEQLAAELVAEDLAHLQALDHQIALGVFVAHDLGLDGAELGVEPVERSHVLVLDHEQQVPVVRVDSVRRDDVVGEHQVLLFRLLHYLLVGLGEALQIVVLEAIGGADEADVPDRALDVGSLRRLSEG